MALDILQSKTRAVTLFAPGTWTGITASCLNSGGTVTSTPTATHLSATVNTIATANASNNYELSVDSETGISVGSWLGFTHYGATNYARCMSINSQAISIWPPLPSSPLSGSTVLGAQIAVTIPSGSTGTYGLNNQLVVTCNEGNEAREVYHVVRRQMVDSVTEADIRSYVYSRWPSNSLVAFQFTELATSVRDELRSELMATANYGHMYLDPTATKQAGLAIASRLLVTQYGLVPPGNTDPQLYLDEVRADEIRYVGRMVSSLEGADKDDDGVPDTDTAKFFSVRIRR